MIPDICSAERRVDLRGQILRPTALAALSAAGLAGSALALAQAPAAGGAPEAPARQEAPARPDAAAGQPEAPAEVVITGTNIVRNGFSAPTPLTVIGQEQFQTSATNNIADYVNTIPAFQNSQTPTNQYHQSSNGLAGLNTLNLRSLGSSRTLVLIDGQRSVGSTTTGLVDINNIPQDLVSRVDIVTGGASAVYGSDALTGVVNFVLDKKFTGTKVAVSGGVTTYGDDPNWKVSLTEGIGFAGDRGHFIVSGEASDDYGIRGVPRSWNNSGEAIIVNPAFSKTNQNGQPQYIRVSQAALYTVTWGGIITNTPLANTAFGPGGTPTIFHLGSIVSNPYTSGGDWASNPSNTIQSLTPEIRSQRIFTRLSYDVTDSIDVFGQFSWAGTHSIGYNEPNFYFGNLTVKSDNAFIPPSVASRLSALGITQFNMGTLNGDLPDWNNNTYRTTKRYVVGANGNFDALGSSWTWSAYVQRGETDGDFRAYGVSDRTRYMLAIDAVRDPATGAIVCRSTLTDPTNGCVPYDLFGTGVNGQAAINYIEPSVPTQLLELTQDVWSAQLSGEPFSDWAGPVSVAAGVQHRREAVSGTADALSGNWFAANYAPIRGSYKVTEGSLETVVPLAKDVFLVKNLEVDAAARATDYSISGYVTTWKFGATWDITPDIRLRANRSRDIRAPNLSELFQTGAGGTGQILDDFRGAQSVLYRIVQAGNLNLQPEKANSTGAGLVLQPTFLPRFNASVDYWQINIDQAIGTIQSQQTFDLCYQGLSQFCTFITPNPATLTAVPTGGYVIVNSPVNLASQKASGIDFEGSYRFDLGSFGNLDLRYLSTHYIKNVTDNRVSPPVDVVGASVPRWDHHLTVTYSNQPFTVALTGRMISSGVLDPTYLVCSTNCPPRTAAQQLTNPTVNDAHQPGAFYLDSSVTYDLPGAGKTDLQVFLNIQNLLNRAPPIVPEAYTGLVPYFSEQTNPMLYDVLGRTFRLGVRFTM
jgi:iron complex outermembrane recepter protein